MHHEAECIQLCTFSPSSMGRRMPPHDHRLTGADTRECSMVEAAMVTCRGRLSSGTGRCASAAMGGNDHLLSQAIFVKTKIALAHRFHLMRPTSTAWLRDKTGQKGPPGAIVLDDHR